MAKVYANINVYDDVAGGVWVAPMGTTGPTTLAAPTAPHKEIGWVSDDGISVERSQDAKSFTAWQGAQVVKRKITSTEDSFKFQCLEENAVVFGLMYRGQVPAVATGVATITVQNQSVSDERAWVFDMIAGAVTTRYVVPSGIAELSGTIEYKSDAITVREFTVTPQGAYFVLTNQTAVVAG